MSAETQRIAALEQSLYAALSAAQQYGIDLDDLRLLAVGGLSLNASWRWVNDALTQSAETELTNAVDVVHTNRR